MAKQFNFAPSMNSRYENVMRDRYGEVIVALGSQDYMVHAPGFGPQRFRLQESLQLVCGTMYSPLMSMSKENPIVLAVCEECRYPYRRGEEPRHGLCNRERGGTCAKCGQFLCPTHAVKCSDDQVRCPRCVNRFRVKQGFLSLFFRKED